MKIWIDVCHIPQYNFFKQLILQLVKQGHNVVVTVMARGRTLKIVKHEMDFVQGVTIVPMGKHKMTRWSAIWDANVLRMLRLLLWVPCQRFDVAFSTNIFTSLFGKLYKIPNFSFGDDPQVYDLKYNCRWATKAHQCIYEWAMPTLMPEGLHILSCLKEWAYLAPNVFQPNPKVLEKYGVKPKQYIFLREVSVGTVNYAGQAAGAIRDVAGMIEEVIGKREEVRGKNDETFHVLFSLEEKNRRSEYPADWILLQEPIEDIHSLIYYSAGLVSSGDSMAREAALLGVPSYYLGVRHSMPANLAASKVAGLQNTLTMPFEQWLNEVRGGDIERIEDRTNRMMQEQEALRKKIDNDFIDINAYMMSLVEKVEQEHNNESSKKI